jgi:RNA polymerase sigma-70 factor (ECF subfamily)
MEYTDAELLRLFQEAGDRHRAFTLILKKYQERIYWHIRHIVLTHENADDVLQNVFLKVWNHLDGFRKDAELYTWLYRIATNESITYIKQKKRELHISVEEYQARLIHALSDDIYFDGDAVQLKLQKAVMQLPEKQKMVFRMRYFDEMSYEDISGILKTSVGSLKASYHHAVKKIEKFLESH